MEIDSKFDCDGYYCVEMLIRSWGHGIDNKTQSLLGELRSIRLQLGKPSSDFGHINRKLDNIERIVQEIPMLPSPFHWESVSLDLLITRRVDQLHQKEFYDSINFQVKLDPNQPRIKTGVLSRFRQYRHLDRTEARLRKLFCRFQFGSLADYFELQSKKH